MKFSHQDWADVATWLLADPGQASVERVLERLGRACDADRAWIIRYNDTFTHFWNTHEWVRPGIPAFVHDLQGIPVSFGHWLNQSLLQGETCAINDLSELPRSAAMLRKEWDRQNIRSLLAAPGFWQGRLLLQVGFDAVDKNRNWTAADIELLNAATCLLTQALCGGPARGASEFPPSAPNTPQVVLKRSPKFEMVPLEDIVLIRAAGDYSQLAFANGQEATELLSLKYWEANLPQESFCRCHRSTIVNLRRIRYLNRKSGHWQLFVKGLDTPVSVGRRYRSVLKHHLGL